MASPIVLAEHAREEGTYVVVVSFKDEVGASVVPSSASWTLTDTDGNIINSRDAVPISPLAATVNIVLSADDLVISTYGTTRLLLIQYVYSSSYGLGLPDKVQIQFEIDDLVGVA